MPAFRMVDGVLVNELYINNPFHASRIPVQAQQRVPVQVPQRPSRPSAKSLVAPVHSLMYWMDLSLHDWQTIEKVTSGYAWQEGATRGQKILRIAYIIWDAIKHLFGLSDWRKGVEALNRNMGTISSKVLEHLKEKHPMIRNNDQVNRKLILSALLHRQFCHKTIASALLKLLIICREKPATAEAFARHVLPIWTFPNEISAWVRPFSYNLQFDPLIMRQKKLVYKDICNFMAYAREHFFSRTPSQILALSQRWTRA